MRFDYKRENPRAATLGFSIPKNGGNKSVGSLPTICSYDIMANYITRDSNNKRSEKIHVIHLLSVTSLEAVTKIL